MDSFLNKTVVGGGMWRGRKTIKISYTVDWAAMLEVNFARILTLHCSDCALWLPEYNPNKGKNMLGTNVGLWHHLRF